MDTRDYLTSTVLGLINNIRQNQDYSLCPILADALQDADFPEDQVFSAMFNKKDHPSAIYIGLTGNILLWRLRNVTDPIAHYRHICILLGGEYLESLLWMDKFADELGDSYDYNSYDDNASPETPLKPTQKMRQKMSYHILMKVAEHNFKTGETMIQYGGEHWQDLFRSRKGEFWKHYEVVTGIEVDKRHDDWGLFGCSC